MSGNRAHPVRADAGAELQFFVHRCLIGDILARIDAVRDLEPHVPSIVVLQVSLNPPFY